MRPVFRLDPVGQPNDYQTYEAKAQTRPATCREVDRPCIRTDGNGVRICFEKHCGSYAHGWTSVFDVGTVLGQKQANYVRIRSGRRFKMTRDGDRVAFSFYPGQPCFAEHTLPIGALYLKRGGDWRATTSEARSIREVDWIDDQREHLDKIQTIRQRG